MKYLVIFVLSASAFFLGFFFNQSGICRAAGFSVGTVPAAEFSRRLSSCPYTLIDIRTAAEFTSGHLADAVNIDFNQTAEFTRYLDTLDKNKTYFIYCRTGSRSARAMKLMTDRGFTSVVDLGGGITAWQSASLPVTK